MVATHAEERSRRGWVVFALAGALLLSACEESFLPPTFLAGPRIMAIESSPLGISMGRPSLRLDAFSYVPEGSAVATESWTLCPITAGPFTGYQCILPECLIPLEIGEVESAGAATTVHQSTLQRDSMVLEALPCFMALAEQAGGEQQEGPGDEEAEAEAAPQGLDAVFSYEFTLADGRETSGIVRVPVWTTEAPSTLNQPPEIEEVRINGERVGEGEEAPAFTRGADVPLEITLSEASAESVVDGFGETQQESLTVSYFSTAGRFRRERTGGRISENRLKTTKDLPAEATRVELFLVARDGRGGQHFSGPYFLPIEGASDAP